MGLPPIANRWCDMLGIYLGCLILGGVFVALSVFSGIADGELELEADGDAELDFDADADVDFDVDGDADFDADGEGATDVVISHRRFRPLLSFRFYTYALTFFGLTGLLLTWVGQGESVLGIGMSALLGLVSGLGASYLVYYVDRDSAQTRPAADSDFRGAQAEVLLPISKDTRGRVRVRIDGRTMDIRAEVDDENIVLDLGDPCFVLDIEEGVAKVIDMKTLQSDG